MAQFEVVLPVAAIQLQEYGHGFEQVICNRLRIMIV